MGSKVTYDKKSYFINGTPVWLASGEIDYFRLTRGDWRRRLLQLRLAGFNTVSTFIPWNFHELSEGEWDFDGDKDVGHFLDTAFALGLYVIVRPGPYINAEWQCGGIPTYVAAKPGVRARTEDPQYLSHVDRWFDKIAPIISERQIDQGGRVILVQVENEYGHFGSYQNESYMNYLRDALRQRGITVPLLTCDSFIRYSRLQPRKWEGMNLCCNFGVDALLNLDRARDVQPDAPLMVSELWTAVFDWWGREQSGVHGDVSVLNSTLETVAGGASGLTIFMFSGGANFGYWHGRSIISEDCFVTTKYGPGAPILDDGNFSSKYHMLKTHLNGLMAGESALAQCEQAELTEISDSIIKAIRRNDKTQFIFYLNQNGKTMDLKSAEKEHEMPMFAIPPGAATWTVHSLPLGNGFTLGRSNAGLFSANPAAVFYARPGGEVSIDFRHEAPFDASESDTTAFKTHVHENHLRIEADAPESEDEMLYAVLSAGGRKLPVVLVNEEAIRRYWRLDLPGAESFICCGPDRIEDAIIEENSITLSISTNSQSRKCRLFTRGNLEEMQPELEEQGARSMPLNDVSVCHRLPECNTDFDDTAWFESERPMPMTAFGNAYGWAWYRARFTVTDSGLHMLHIAGAADRGLIFVDGRFADERGVHTHCGWSITLNLEAGEHTLALLIENLGMFSTGAELDIPLAEPKGLTGPVWINGQELSHWRMRAGLMRGEDPYYWPDVTGELEGFGPPDEDILRGPLLMRATFLRPEGFDGSARLVFGEGAIKGNVWINGYNIGRYWKLGPDQTLWLPLSRLKDNNHVMIFEESEIVPRRIRVHYEPFGYSGILKFSKEQLTETTGKKNYGMVQE